MILLVSALVAVHLISCSAKEIEVSCDDTDNSTEIDTCISNYSALDSYIVNDRDLQEQFTKAFFKTGQRASEFVKLTYHFQKSDTTNNTDSDGINCTNAEITYIWSQSVLYLLGPRSLFWLTLFAVNVPEASVTIDLPCFCADAYSALLSRLTYLV